MEYTGNFNYQDDLFFDLKPNLSEDTYSSTPSAYTNIEENAQKALSSPLLSSNSSSSGFLISFSSSPINPQEEEEDIVMISSHLEENVCQESLGEKNNNNIMYKRSSVQAQDHVIAERKRRKKMGELFISLSKIVPGLKKLDKSSILGDTIQYMKELQEQVKLLEQTEKNTCDNNDSSTSKDQVEGSKIKARILDKSVLINIHCSKQDGMVGRVLFQMEQLHLSVHDIRIMPFGRTNLEISILAEMENGCCITVEDIVKDLQINLLEQV